MEKTTFYNFEVLAKYITGLISFQAKERDWDKGDNCMTPPPPQCGQQPEHEWFYTNFIKGFKDVSHIM